MSRLPFDYRKLIDGEEIPAQYLFWDGLQWTRGSAFRYEVYGSLADHPVIAVPMLPAEVAEIDMTFDMWLSMTPEERLRYNTPAILAQARGKRIQQLTNTWSDTDTYPNNCYPFRIARLTTEPVWYMVQYPDGTGMAYRRESDAVHSSGGNPVICVKEAK